MPHFTAESADNAFEHATLKFGAGPSDAVIMKRLCNQRLVLIKEHFAAVLAKRNLALSLDPFEGHETFSYQHNNIH